MIKLKDILNELEISNPNGWERELEKVIDDKGLVNLDESETFEMDVNNIFVKNLYRHLSDKKYDAYHPLKFEYNNVLFFVYLSNMHTNKHFIVIELV